MSFLFGGGPKPPPPPPTLASPSIMQQGASERSELAAANGEGMSGTDVTGGQGAKAPSTTASGAGKSTLGG